MGVRSGLETGVPPWSRPRVAGRKHPERARPVLLGIALLASTTAGSWLLAAHGGLAVESDRQAGLALVIGLLGCFVLWHRPDNRIGLLLAVTGTLFGMTVLAGGVMYSGLPSWVRQGALAVDWMGVALAAPWILLILWFPDGRFPSPAWKGFFIASTALLVLIGATAYLFGSTAALPAAFPVGAVPTGLAGPLPQMSWGPVSAIADTLFAGLPLIAIAALVQRFRRSDPFVRQQIRLVLVAALVSAVGGVIGETLLRSAGSGRGVGLIIGLITQPLPGVAIALSIVTRRLWDIELVISKALVYAVLWAIVSGLLLAPAFAAELVVGSAHPMAALVGAFLVTAFFRPARTRLERIVERVVYRHRPRGYAVLTRFWELLKASIDPEELGPRLVETVRFGLGVSWAAVWICVETQECSTLHPLGAAGIGQGSEVVLSPEASAFLRSAPGMLLGADAADAFDHPWARTPAALVPLLAADEPVGLLACGERKGDPLTEGDLELLALVGREGALGLRNLRLEAQLRDQLTQIELQAGELRRSRQRLVATQDEERRRIERDLHDGVQQQLVALAVRLRRAGRDAPPEQRARMDQLADEAEDVVFSLQELARGIYPGVLADQGLPAAVRTQADRIPQRVRLDLGPGVLERRFDRETEVALYFVGLEALANAQKHAPSATVSISLRLDLEPSRLVLEVDDDGPGFAPGQAASGAGLQNMRDRMAAVGGTLEIDTGPGAGTRVRAEVPAGDEDIVLRTRRAIP